jgi:hypothetical protein
MAIEIDSSPQAAFKEEPSENDDPGNKPRGAPIPDMGMGIGLDMDMSSASQPLLSIKDENSLSQTLDGSHAGVSSAMKTEDNDSNSQAPIAGMDINLEGPQAGMGGADDGVLDLTNSDLNFTDMEFTLAPTNDGQAQPSGDGNVAAGKMEPSFDLSSFDTTGGTSGNNMSSLDGVPPNDLMGQPTSTATAPVSQMAAAQPNAGQAKKEEAAVDASLADVFTGDGQADGMDFDFSLGDGMGGDTFDDLMNDRDNTFDAMEHGDFDANFFGLDKIDEA